jgi:hypothetical protein
MMRMITILAATLAATPCWILAASAQDQAGSLAGNISVSNMQNAVAGPELGGVRSNDLALTPSNTGPTAGILAPSAVATSDLTNSMAVTAGVDKLNQQMQLQIKP